MAAKEKRKTNNKKRAFPIAIASCIVIIVAAIGIIGLNLAKDKYSDTFLPNTYINGLNVSGKSLEEAKAVFANNEGSSELVVTKRDGSTVNIPVSKFDYKYNTNEKIDELYKNVDHGKWLKSLFNDTKYTFKSESSYDAKKLAAELKTAKWVTTKNQNAKIVKGDNGFEIQPEVRGDNMNYAKLQKFIIDKVNNNELDIKAEDSGCYIEPAVKEADLADELKKFQSAYNQKITLDFDYTTETLTGDKLIDMLTLNSKGEFDVDEDKVMKYVEELAAKYDTYNTERKFKATIQGNITVPTSSDAKYGWWIDQQKTCDMLADLIKKGKDVAKTDPIYYQDGNFVFTGLESARTANDDIGKTYVEVDLSNQHLWYYLNGKKAYECDIVSGQTTSAARTTLPGVYKVWDKATNYRMKDTNSDGDRWDTTCAYWTRVAIVGIGLHDSQWRGGYFGGTIYQYNGSHGCINMPYDGAKYIYENVAMDTPVVMYY